MKVRRILIVLFVLFAFSDYSGVYISAQTAKLVIANFDTGERKTNLGEDFGTWNKDPADQSQGCQMKFLSPGTGEKGKAVAIDYDVDSANPAYCGFWMKIADAPAADFDTLSFYIRGDGKYDIPQQIKIEIKDNTGHKAGYKVENLSPTWQRISLTLNRESIIHGGKYPFREFVIVFDDFSTRPKTGRIVIDQVEFSKNLL